MSAEFDWSKFFSISDEITFWDILDSQFLTTLFIIFVTITLWFYDRRAKKAVERADDITEVLGYIEDARDREEAAEVDLEDRQIAEPVIAQDLGHRQEASRVVENAKDHLEGRVKSDKDQRHHRTYSNIPRHDYTVLAVALRDRNQISEEQLNAAVQLFSDWRRYARGRAAQKAVPEAVLRSLERAYQTMIATP